MATDARVDPVATIRSWLDEAAALPDADLATWRSTVGGVTVEFRCTDRSLAELCQARLVQADAQSAESPVLKLDLLETRSLGWQAPEAALDGVTLAGQLTRRLAEERLSVLRPKPGWAYPWICFDPRTARGVTLVRTTDDLPPWTFGAPFALALHLAFAWRGWRFVHAAAIGCDGVGALVAGPGGVGKSGTTLAAISDGLVTVGDDYLLLAPGSQPVAWPVYRLLKQDPAGLLRAGRADLAGRGVNWMGKIELDLESEFPGRIARALELRLILLPEIAHAKRTEVQPVPPAAAFSAIAPSVLSQLPGARMAGFTFLTRLTRALPAYRLQLSQDPPEIARALRRLLSR